MQRLQLLPRTTADEARSLNPESSRFDTLLELRKRAAAVVVVLVQHDLGGGGTRAAQRQQCQRELQETCHGPDPSDDPLAQTLQPAHRRPFEV